MLIPLLIAASTAIDPVLAEPEPTTINRLVVFNLRASGMNPEVANTLSQIFAFSIRQALPGVTTLGQTDIDDLLALGEKQQLMGCEDMSCLAQISGALGADYLATGSVGRIGVSWLGLFGILSRQICVWGRSVPVFPISGVGTWEQTSAYLRLSISWT